MNSPSVCVYCASNRNTPEPFRKIAREVGRFLAKEKINLVYGGASIGMMGEVADACLEGGGNVTGVIPQSLVDAEVAHTGLTKLIVTKDMHERKMTMFDLSDAFVTLPGGLGTLEETLEVITWRYLDLHTRPVIILNLDQFYDRILAQFDHCKKEGLTREGVENNWQVCASSEKLFALLRNLR